MRTIVIYQSIHHGNTEKIAKVMAKTLNAKLAKPGQVRINTLENYDLIGFGLGIYFQRHHQDLFKLIEKLPILKNKKSFIFSTSGLKEIKFINDFNKPQTLPLIFFTIPTIKTEFVLGQTNRLNHIFDALIS